MTLSIEQKSVYLTIINSTMILRSIGQRLRNHCRLREFKIRVVKESEILIDKMEKCKLLENDIIVSIDKFCDEFNISFGQAQKAINVLLKYHYYLYEKYLTNHSKIKSVLHCPLDSKILEELHIRNKPLTRIDKKEYIDIQNEIHDKMYSKGLHRIDFDREVYDTGYLKDRGIL